MVVHRGLMLVRVVVVGMDEVGSDDGGSFKWVGRLPSCGREV